MTTDHEQQSAAARLRVCPYRESRVNDCLQGNIERSRRFDLHRHSTSGPSAILEHDPTLTRCSCQAVQALKPDQLSAHVNRIGHHIRETIVEQARASIGESDESSPSCLFRHFPGQPEPIPDTQQEINEQADAAIRDLFPRIPNTDRQMIIERSFKKVCTPPSSLDCQQSEQAVPSRGQRRRASRESAWPRTSHYLVVSSLPFLRTLDTHIPATTTS